jgi:uncharacterized protein YjgD (DUF1641 family)|tara:strand:+ start:169 stop:552 length:384 start_codon:yes stop_codon:yes gene_type:complete
MAEDQNKLKEMSELETIACAVKDALSDDMITRLSSTMSEGISLVDRITRNEALMRLIRDLDRPENQRFLNSVSAALSTSNKDFLDTPINKGSALKMYRLIREPGVYDMLQLLSSFSRHFSSSMHNKK